MSTIDTLLGMFRIPKIYVNPLKDNDVQSMPDILSLYTDVGKKMNIYNSVFSSIIDGFQILRNKFDRMIDYLVTSSDERIQTIARYYATGRNKPYNFERNQPDFSDNDYHLIWHVICTRYPMIFNTSGRLHLSMSKLVECMNERKLQTKIYRVHDDKTVDNHKGWLVKSDYDNRIIVIPTAVIACSLIIPIIATEIVNHGAVGLVISHLSTALCDPITLVTCGGVLLKEIYTQRKLFLAGEIDQTEMTKRIVTKMISARICGAGGSIIGAYVTGSAIGLGLISSGPFALGVFFISFGIGYIGFEKVFNMNENIKRAFDYFFPGEASNDTKTKAMNIILDGAFRTLNFSNGLENHRLAGKSNHEKYLIAKKMFRAIIIKIHPDKTKGKAGSDFAAAEAIGAYNIIQEQYCDPTIDHNSQVFSQLFTTDGNLILGLPNAPTFELEMSPIRAHIENICCGRPKLKMELENFVNIYVLQTKQDKAAVKEGTSVESTKGWNSIRITGNPGTGKTEFAKCLAELLVLTKYVDNDKIVFISDPNTLVGRYCGHTAVKVKEQFQNAQGGVLVIDEIYVLLTIATFGQEAIDTIMTLMTKSSANPNPPALIFLGYKNKMDEFVKTNEGIRRRIKYDFNLDPYTVDKLSDIFINYVERNDYKSSVNVQDITNLLLTSDDKLTPTDISIIKKKYNGGICEKLFDYCKENLASRIDPDDNLTLDVLVTFNEDDIIYAIRRIKDSLRESYPGTYEQEYENSRRRSPSETTSNPVTAYLVDDNHNQSVRGLEDMVNQFLSVIHQIIR